MGIEEERFIASLGPSPEMAQSAAEWYREGVTFPEIRTRLRNAGVQCDDIDSMIGEVASSEIGRLLLINVSHERIIDTLVKRGLEPHQAEDVIAQVEAIHGKKRAKIGFLPRSKNWKARETIGIVLLVLGPIIWIGNKSGIFPTIPLLGFCMIAGGAMLLGVNIFRDLRK
jgi:hypothetical protein